ncbi:hypothetical protein ABZ383_34750 [Streptomyces sp. NPDC005900]|uniref:hypothetical protein n=1 Tax=Streptomyces sp. NPDC005900 TaxID=3154569 RepID=UPI0033D42868
MSTTTTSYGTWCNQVNTYSTSPDADVDDYIGGGPDDWRTLLEESGALERIKSEYRAAINAALPGDVALCGDEFIGPWEPEEGEFDGYPQDEDGTLDFAAMVEDIDLAEIVERNEPLTLEDIGRDELKSTAVNPAKTASGVLAKLKPELRPKPIAYLPHPQSRRPQAIYLAGEVRAALAARPGRGVRTDLKGSE